MISEFQGKYRFLSNFYPAMIKLDNLPYPTVEHAYQAAKTLDLQQRNKIRQCANPGEAKRAGRQVTLRDDWESVKLATMLDLLRQKFNSSLYSIALLATDPQELVEGNHWNDHFWGVCEGVGENHLGRLLMQVRDELKMAPVGPKYPFSARLRKRIIF